MFVRVEDIVNRVVLKILIGPQHQLAWTESSWQHDVEVMMYKSLMNIATNKNLIVRIEMIAPSFSQVVPIHIRFRLARH